jgi:hypothetical protein
MKRNFKQLNPELVSGDRITLIHMEDESIGIGTKGKVIKRVEMPKFSNSDLGYLYEMEWMDDDGNVYSKLSLIPETDSWTYDKQYYSSNPDEINESKEKSIEDLAKILLALPKSKMKIVKEYLESIRKLGVVNMFEAPSLIGVSKQYFKDYMRMKSYEREYDEELVEEITNMADEVRNIMISQSISNLEKSNKEITPSSVQREMRKLAIDCTRNFMGMY